MARRKFERGMVEWQRRLLVGEAIDDLDEVARFDALLDGTAELLMPLWRRHRAELLRAWGTRPHPMDSDPPRVPKPRR